MNFEIRKVDIETLYKAVIQIPEFDPHYSKESYFERLSGVTNYIIAAFADDTICGFKAGYELEPGIFYSWVGAVLPQYRRQGVAKILAEEQENWLRKNGYHTLRMKTRNKFKNMLLFAITNGFMITNFVAYKNNLQSRIHLEKQLKAK